MIHKVWRLSENSGDDNLGLACTEQGLVLGRTALIERRNASFVARARSELEHLLGCAYRTKLNIDLLMPGLATVAAALNANDQGLARIAAVHLRIPDLPDKAARCHGSGGHPHQVGRLESRAASARRYAAKSRLVRANGRRRQRIIFNTNGAKRRSDAPLGCFAKR